MKPTGNPAIDNSTAQWIVGSDECGFGCWAGDLVVAGTRLPRGWTDPGVGDSKKLSEVKREQAYRRWTETEPVPYCRVAVSAKVIDQHGVWECLIQAHRKVLSELLKGIDPDDVLVVVDGFKGQGQKILPQAIGLPKADDLIPAVSLGSIIAKVWRDRQMVELAKKYPGYGFQNHKGYGTDEHQQALLRLGVTDIHRRSYAPVTKALIAQDTPALGFDE